MTGSRPLQFAGGQTIPRCIDLATTMGLRVVQVAEDQLQANRVSERTVRSVAMPTAIHPKVQDRVVIMGLRNKDDTSAVALRILTRLLHRGGSHLLRKLPKKTR